VLEQIGGWSGERAYEDWDVWMGLAEAGYRGIHMGPSWVTYRRRVHTGRRGADLRTNHPKLYRALQERHPRLFGDLQTARQESDLSPVRKVLYPIVYGGRRRLPGEPRIKAVLDRVGIWTLKR
jgi:hypothetical protein